MFHGNASTICCASHSAVGAGSPQTRASVDVRDRCCLKSRFSGWRRDRCAQHSSATRDGASRAWRWSEIFMLKAETAARESKELITRSAAQFVPITLPAGKATSVRSIRHP